MIARMAIAESAEGDVSVSWLRLSNSQPSRRFDRFAAHSPPRGARVALVASRGRNLVGYARASGDGCGLALVDRLWTSHSRLDNRQQYDTHALLLRCLVDTLARHDDAEEICSIVHSKDQPTWRAHGFGEDDEQSVLLRPPHRVPSRSFIQSLVASDGLCATLASSDTARELRRSRIRSQRRRRSTKSAQLEVAQCTTGSAPSQLPTSHEPSHPFVTLTRQVGIALLIGTLLRLVTDTVLYNTFNAAD